MKKYIFIAILMIALMIFFSKGIDCSKSSISQEEIKIKLTNKFIDNDNHGDPVIVGINKDGQNEEYSIINWTYKSNLWNYLQIGDSVIKTSGTLTLRVKKEDGSYKDYEYQR